MQYKSADNIKHVPSVPLNIFTLVAWDHQENPTGIPLLLDYESQTSRARLVKVRMVVALKHY